jgi:dsDNA-specific endonuclease/ATPase MutS2
MPDDPRDERDADEDDEDADWEAPIEMEIEDSLDLHTFAPRDVKDVVTDYVELAADKGFAEVRIIHGKGQGTLRRIVHAVLEKHPRVASFRLGGTGAGSWGATIAVLRQAPPGGAGEPPPLKPG